MLVSVAGPAINFLLAGIFYWFPSFVGREIIIYANVLIGAVNLLPIYPLDGGRIEKAILSRWCEGEIVDELLYKTSNSIMIFLTVLASVGILYLQNIAILLIIAYLWLVRIAENKKHRIKMRVRKTLKEEKIPVQL